MVKAGRKVVGGVYTLAFVIACRSYHGMVRGFSKCAPFWVVAPVALCCWSLGTQSVAGAPVDALAVGFHLHARDPGEMVGSDPS